ncbi:DUF1885 family protein [Bacillus testis]|uniref:DUF1885 family protein n=1 Tax=Bacillus testis TaxID=1622072 RepID=UPI00084119F9|nr:DUF1885 family protein [Bacillus testis]
MIKLTEQSFIKLVPQAKLQQIAPAEIRELLHSYKECTEKTGTQVKWHYSHYAFPYVIKECQDQSQWLCLQSDQYPYNLIILFIGNEFIKTGGEERLQNYIGIGLTSSSTAGDQTKANEIGRFLSKKLQGEWHMFNRRVKYDYARK